MTDIEIFGSGPIIFNEVGVLEDTNRKINNDITGWTKVKVPIGTEFVDELTSVTKYEYRYRLYLSDVYRELGCDNIADFYKEYYWEKDENGKMVECYLP